MDEYSWLYSTKMKIQIKNNLKNFHELHIPIINRRPIYDIHLTSVKR